MSELIHQERNGNSLIQIWQEDDRRSLWFDDVILQSEIHLDDPAVLPNPVNRAMLAHLMFGQQPDHVLLAGCGGGAIARWLNHRSAQTRGDAVELSSDVARIARKWFDFPGPGSHWQLHVEDIRDFLQDRQDVYDFILVDLEERQYSPDWISEEPFLRQCRSALTDQGVLTINLIPDGPNRYTKALWNIRTTFEQQTLCLPVPQHDNQLVMAFNRPPGIDDVQGTMREAACRWGLRFATYWDAIRQANPQNSGIL